jgi:hypothetical protein
MTKRSRSKADEEPSRQDSTLAKNGSRAAYETFLQHAVGLDRNDVVPMRGDLTVVEELVQSGLASVLAHADTVAAELPAVRVDELKQLVDIVGALRFANDEIERLSLDAKQLGKLLDRGRTLRKRLMRAAREVGEAGDLPNLENEVPSGKSPSDVAEACGRLAERLQDHARKRKKEGVISINKLTEARDTAVKLRDMAPAVTESSDAAIARATDMRDRFWAFLIQRYDRLWRVGAYLFGPEVDHHVPNLRALGPKGLAKAKWRDRNDFSGQSHRASASSS